MNNEATMLGLLQHQYLFLQIPFIFIFSALHYLFRFFNTVFLLIIGLHQASLFLYKKNVIELLQNYQESLEEINLESVDIANNYYLIKFLKSKI